MRERSRVLVAMIGLIYGFGTAECVQEFKRRPKEYVKP
jgi:YHS domain-containing protein